MFTIVVAGYAVLMLAIVLAVFGAAARPTPKPPSVVFDQMPARRMSKPVFKPTIPNANNGGSEVLAFEA